MRNRRQFLQAVTGIGVGGGLLVGNGIASEDENNNSDDPPRWDPSTSGLRGSLKVRIERDIIFQKTPEKDLTLNLYEPITHAWSPALVFVHGGAWTTGSAEFSNSRLIRMAQQGYVGIDVNYRLGNEKRYPAAVKDVNAAIKWLRENAEEYNVNTDKIAIMGSSAGAHLSSLVANATDIPKFEPEGFDPDTSSQVQAVIGQWGVYDFTTLIHESNVRQWLGGRMGKIPEIYREASPINYVSEDSPPHFLMHGHNDHNVPIEQSYKMEQALEDHGVDVETWYPEGRPHVFSQAQGSADHPTAECDQAEMLDRVERYLIEKIPKEDLLAQGKPHGNRMNDVGVNGNEIKGEGETTFGGDNSTRSSYFSNDGDDPSCDLKDVEAEDSGLNVTWIGE